MEACEGLRFWAARLFTAAGELVCPMFCTSRWLV
jgi:hypothetical protein